MRSARWLLLLAAILPFEFDGLDAVWPWQGLVDSGLVDGLALLAPMFAALLAFGLVRCRPQKVALSLSLLVVIGLGCLLSAWSRLVPHPLGVFENLSDGLPPLFSRSLWLLVSGQALLAAGLRLGGRGLIEPMEGRPSLSDPWPAARVLTALGVVAVIAFYLLPYRGTMPLLELLGDIGILLAKLEELSALALLAGHILSLGPLAFALVAMWHLFRPAKGRGGPLAGFLIVYLPCLCLVVGLRNLPFLPAYTLVHLRSAALLFALTGGLALSVAALLRALWFEIPWLFGRLTRFDDMLAASLSAPDATDSLQRSMERLNPLLRIWLRRRLALWRSAASGLPEAGAADLSRVMILLERRWREERNGPNSMEVDESDKPPAWPPWAIGHRLSLLLVFLVVTLLGLTWGMAHRSELGMPWILEEPAKPLHHLFTEQFPEVVMDMSRNPGMAIERLPRFKELKLRLREFRTSLPGLDTRMQELLRLGHKGRSRIRRIRRARDDLNHLLRAHNVPFFVSSRVRAQSEGPDMFYVLVYRILACRRYQHASSQQVFAVLELSRVDRLNIVENYLGMTEHEETYVTVFSDRLEQVLGGRLRNLMAQDGVLAEEALKGWIAGRPEGAADLGVESGPGLDLLREGLTRHELHHRWMGLEPEPSTLLWTRLDGFSEDAVRGVTAEVGAYLGELRSSPAYARLRLALMLDSALRPMGSMGIHGRARDFILEQILLPELAVDFSPRIHGAAAAERLAEFGDDDLIERVDVVHRKVFGVGAPVFVPIKDSF
ncbi:MAG: hypothetical protein JRF33_00570 [Deltaproteobacteria bacterium]|nr:hypothetical protein [Deltaproteobacteria bacterium]